MKVFAVIAILGFSIASSWASPGLRATGVEFSSHDGALWEVVQVDSQDGRLYSYGDGLLQGQMTAERIGTGGNMVGGLAVGALTGLIGTGIGYFLIGPAQPDGYVNQMFSGKGGDYQSGFMAGWDKKTRSRKRNAFLGGGLLGTLAFVVLVAGSWSKI